MLDAEFDFDDFLKQSKLVTKMGSLAGVAAMLPGMANSLDPNQMREVEGRLRKNEAMIRSMTKKERADPELLIKDATSRSRLLRITKGSGMKFEDGMQFVSEFQRMRTMMSRMQKQMGGGDPAMAGGPDGMGEMPVIGNRQARRNAKKKKKGGRGGGGGFG
jgi:signal recognition particle subunit SRP54